MKTVGIDGQRNQERLEEVCSALENVLADESIALRRLDADAIDRLATHKLLLGERLARARAGIRPDAAQLRRLDQLRRHLLSNQMLLVSARNCLRGIVSLAAGDVPGAVSPSATVTPARGVR